MSNPAKSADDIDWDKMAKRLGAAFDAAMKVAERNEEHNDGVSIDGDFKEALELANATAVALAKVAAEARAVRENAEAKRFSIDKSPVR